jgi:chorismate--pyruvate lyase
MHVPHRFSLEPQWRPRSQIWRCRVPPALRDWLLDTSSLTGRLRACCDGRFRVTIVDQAYRAPSAEERLTLGLRGGSRALVRQVHLCCGETPWVFARTVVPLRSLRGRGRSLARLGARPLGELLFADPHLLRGNREIGRLAPGMPLYGVAMGHGKGTDPLWGRRSLFAIAGKPLLVSEFFLPGFTAALESEDDALS